jgi:hypothetical protein
MAQIENKNTISRSGTKAVINSKLFPRIYVKTQNTTILKTNLNKNLK